MKIRNLLTNTIKNSSVFITIIYLALGGNMEIWAEPYYFGPNIIKEVSRAVDNIENFQDKIKYIDKTYEKINNVQNKNKKLILSDISIFRKNFISKNLKTYVSTKYFTGNLNILKEGKKIYQTMKLRDLTVDIHPNYLNSLEQKIKINLELNENTHDFKLYTYILHGYLLNKDTLSQTTAQKLSQIGNFSVDKEYLDNISYYTKFFTKLVSFEKINPLSKDDFERIYSKIIKENISPGSDYMKGFFAWYGKYSKILSNTYLILNNSIEHTKQAYNLSCEANSAKDLINYINKKYSYNKISEDDILNILPSYTGGLTKNQSGELLWHNPNKVFLGDINGRQSSNPNKFSGYGVYAEPIIQAIKGFTSSKISFAKTSISEEKIIESIFNDKPVMFWYLTPVKKGKGYGYQYSPIKWRTFDGDNVNGYIGEHTGILVGYDISRKGAIENVYFYEGRSSGLQKMSYETFKHTTSFFNQMIIVNDN